jgi:hypothetical protein
VLRLVLAAPAFADAVRVGEASQGPPRVDSLRFSPPSPVASMDMEELKGEPARLAWSPDGTQLYLQTLEGEFGRPDPVLHHYVLSASTGAREDLQVEPEWASRYWTSKSGQTSPDEPPLKIELVTERQKQQTTSLPRGGGLARGSSDPAMTENDELSILGAQSVLVITLRLGDEVVGQFTNSVLVPGLTYGWGPIGAKIIAFAAQKTGRVVVMDDLGQKREIAGSRNAILPAWSPDGDRVAWLQKGDGRRYVLQVSRVSVS